MDRQQSSNKISHQSPKWHTKFAPFITYTALLAVLLLSLILYFLNQSASLIPLIAFAIWALSTILLTDITLYLLKKFYNSLSHNFREPVEILFSDISLKSQLIAIGSGIILCHMFNGIQEGGEAFNLKLRSFSITHLTIILPLTFLMLIDSIRNFRFVNYEVAHLSMIFNIINIILSFYIVVITFPNETLASTESYLIPSVVSLGSLILVILTWIMTYAFRKERKDLTSNADSDAQSKAEDDNNRIKGT